MKKFLIFAAVVLAAIIAYSAFTSSGSPLVTGSRIWLKGVTVTKTDPADYSEKTAELTAAEARAFYRELKKTPATVNDFPTHMESIQMDPMYKAEIRYRGGKADIVYLSENMLRVYRFTDSRGDSGDQGYVMGEENKNLLPMFEVPFK